MKDYISHSQSEAIVEVELCGRDGQPNTHVQMTISRARRSATWLIDGSSVTMAGLRTHMNDFGIDVSSKCVYLPQETFYDFSRLSPEDRLEETERLQCDADLYNTHGQLNKSSKTVMDANVCR